MREDELLQIGAHYVLQRIGGKAAVKAVRTHWEGSLPEFRLAAGNVLGGLKRPEAERAVLELLEEETDETARTEFFIALYELYFVKAPNVLRAEIKRGFDYTLTNLEEDLMAVAPVPGVELPEAERWRIGEESRKKRRRLYYELKEKDLDEEACETGSTAGREGPKTGRKDPCPCGSGRNYKKGCGR